MTRIIAQKLNFTNHPTYDGLIYLLAENEIKKSSTDFYLNYYTALKNQLHSPVPGMRGTSLDQALQSRDPSPEHVKMADTNIDEHAKAMSDELNHCIDELYQNYRAITLEKQLIENALSQSGIEPRTRSIAFSLRETAQKSPYVNTDSQHFDLKAMMDDVHHALSQTMNPKDFEIVLRDEAFIDNDHNNGVRGLFEDPEPKGPSWRRAVFDVLVPPSKTDRLALALISWEEGVYQKLEPDQRSLIDQSARTSLTGARAMLLSQFGVHPNCEESPVMPFHVIDQSNVRLIEIDDHLTHQSIVFADPEEARGSQVLTSVSENSSQKKRAISPVCLDSARRVLESDGLTSRFRRESHQLLERFEQSIKQQGKTIGDEPSP